MIIVKKREFSHKIRYTRRKADETPITLEQSIDALKAAMPALVALAIGQVVFLMMGRVLQGLAIGQERIMMESAEMPYPLGC